MYNVKVEILGGEAIQDDTASHALPVVPDNITSIEISEIGEKQILFEAISDEVSKKIWLDNKMPSWNILKSEPYSIEVIIVRDYAFHHTTLREHEALQYIIREALEYNGESKFSSINTACQIEWLIKVMTMGVDINKPYPILTGEDYKDDITPLSQTASNHNLVLLNFLLSHNAIVTPSVLRKISCSIFGPPHKHIKTVQFLIGCGIDINIYDDFGGVMHTTFFSNCYNNDFMAFLLNNNLNPSITDKYGRTLLHIAVQKTNYQQAFMLIDFGADLYYPDNKGVIPLDLASDYFKEGLKRHYKEHQDKTEKDTEYKSLISRLPLASFTQSAVPHFINTKKAAPVSYPDHEETYSEILDINPSIKAQESKHCLTIIFDPTVIAKYDDQGKMIDYMLDKMNIGHYYVGLGTMSDNIVCEAKQKFGMNPRESRLPVTAGSINDESDRYKNASEFEKHFSKKIIERKAIPLTEKQFSAIQDFKLSKERTPGLYIAHYQDCIEFVNEVLEVAGLKGIKVNDILGLDKTNILTLAKISARFRGISGKVTDMFSTAEEVATYYNVPLDRIKQIFPDQASAGIKNHFMIIPFDEYLSGTAK